MQPADDNPSALFDKTLEATLHELVPFMASCADPWCIFGGAALHLHGHGQRRAADIDILATTADCRTLATIWGIGNDADGGTERFRSRAVLRPNLGPIPVEIMGGFEIFAQSRWHEVEITEIQKVAAGAAIVPVASLADLCAILRLSGRRKDHERLALIEHGHSDIGHRSR